MIDDSPPAELSPADLPSAIRAVLEAEQAARAAQQELRLAVVRARGEGHAWSEVGRVLGITRQAAFKRFGGPRDPRTGRAMTADPVSGPQLLAAAEQLWRDVDAGDYDAVRAVLPEPVAEVLTRDVVLGTWAQVVAETGNLERCADARLETGDGSPVADGDLLLGLVVVHAELVCEVGSWVGRVAFDETRHPVGLYVAPTSTPRADYPF